jgi:hypothetical protein
VVALAVAALLIVASCTQSPPHTGAEVRVADGVLPAGAWSAAVYRSIDSGLCLQIRVEGQEPNTICGMDGRDGTSLWRPEAAGVTFIAGTSEDVRAVAVRIGLADGSELRGAAVPAPGLTDVRSFAIPVAAGGQPTRLEILDADGTVVDSVPLE